jgi:hypothetical protein
MKQKISRMPPEPDMQALSGGSVEKERRGY